MKVVVGNRGSGVTTSMLLDAAQHGGTSYQVNMRMNIATCQIKLKLKRKDNHND